MDATTTLDAVKAWPVEDQLGLVFDLWDQIVGTGWRPSPGPILVAELQARIAAHDADPGRAMTWDEVVAHAKRGR